MEVQHSGMISDEMIIQSMHTMMARFQPQIHRAQGDSNWYHKRNVEKYVAAMRMQVDAMAERLAEMRKKAAAAEASKQRSKGKGKGKGASTGKGRNSSGDTTETDTDSDSRSKGSKGSSNRAGKNKNTCWQWEKFGDCRRQNCPWSHGEGGMVMVLDRLEELSERFAAMQGATGGFEGKEKGRDPTMTLNTQRSPGLSTRESEGKVMIQAAPNILMNNMRVRGHRKGIRQANGKENRAQKTVTIKEALR